nr:MAG TPA: hypothetical protein [Caudoviricetes sp.]
MIGLEKGLIRLIVSWIISPPNRSQLILSVCDTQLHRFSILIRTRKKFQTLSISQQ